MSSRLIAQSRIESKILLVRGQKVMLDYDLAEIYGVSTFRLNEQVKRNKKRFPKDFMFQLTKKEFINLTSQFAISSWGGRRHLPYVFSEQGVAMLSSVLNSERAVLVNIAIMRAFVKLRETLSLHKELAAKLNELERTVEGNSQAIHDIFEAIRGLMKEEKRPKRRIGFYHK